MSAWEGFWRAFATITQPRVLAWAMLPTVLAVTATGLAGWLGWEAALDGVQGGLAQVVADDGTRHWLHRMGFDSWRVVLAPMLVVAAAVPLTLTLTLLLVAALAAPAVARRVAQRLHPPLEACANCSTARRAAWMLGSTAVALLALTLSVPLWLVPPFVMLLPPLIWGWLAARLLAYQALAGHATPEERRRVRRGRRGTLLLMGVGLGFMAALPSALWSLGSMALVLAPLLMPAAVLGYAIVFVFGAAWFAHVTLGELARLRAAAAPPVIEASA